MMKPSEIIAPLKGVFSRKTDGYTAIPVPVTQEEADKAQRQQVEQAQRQQKLMKMTIGGLVLVAIVFLAAVYKYVASLIVLIHRLMASGTHQHRNVSPTGLATPARGRHGDSIPHSSMPHQR